MPRHPQGGQSVISATSSATWQASADLGASHGRKRRAPAMGIALSLAALRAFKGVLIVLQYRHSAAEGVINRDDHA